MEADDFQQVTKTVGTDINSLPEIADLPKVMITPMTTVVSNYFQDNQADGLSLENAKNQISTAMGIDPTFLNKDPIEELKKPESQTKAAKYLKESLKIQKLTESLSKSLISDEVDFSTSFTSVMRTFAEKIGKENKTDFVKMMSEDMSDFAKSVISKIPQDLSPEKQAEKLIKLKSSGEVTSQVAITLDKIDTENMDPKQYSNVAKATEEVTSSVEEKIKDLAQVDLNLSEESIAKINSGEDVNLSEVVQNDAFLNVLNEAKDIANAVVAMGGIDVMADKIAEGAKEILTDDIVENFSNVYDKFQDLNISPDNMIDVMVQINNPENNVSLAEAVQNVTGQKVETEKIENSINSATQVLNSFVESFVQNNNVIEETTETALQTISSTINYKKLDLDNSIIFENSLNQKTILPIENGVFQTVTYDSLKGDGDIQSISIGVKPFSLFNYEFTINIGVKIQDLNSSLALFAIVPDVKVVYSNGDLLIDQSQIKTLYGYGVKRDGTELSTSIESDLKYIDIVDNRIILDYATIINKILSQDKISSISASSINSYLTSNGEYQLSIYLTGLNNLTSTNLVAIDSTNTLTGFEGTDFTTNISEKLGDDISVISGDIITSEPNRVTTIVDNKVELKTDNSSIDLNLVDGDFGDFNYSQISDNNDTLETISFDVENSGYVNGDSLNLTVGLKIKDNNSQKIIMAIVPDVVLNYENGEFSINSESAQTLNAYAIKENGDEVSAEITSDLRYLTVSNNKFTLDYTAVFDAITTQDKFNSINTNSISDYLGSDDRNYSFNLYIQGFNNVVGLKNITDTEIVSGFEDSDFSTNIATKLNEMIFGVTGTIK